MQHLQGHHTMKGNKCFNSRIINKWNSHLEVVTSGNVNSFKPDYGGHETYILRDTLYEP